MEGRNNKKRKENIKKVKKVDKNAPCTIFVMMDFLADKTGSGRLSKSEALELLKNASPIELGEAADRVRRKLHGDNAYYAVNAAITYSNICEALCPICSFSRKEGAVGAYLLAADEVFKRAKAFSEKGAQEIHIIGGMYSKLPLEYYLDVVKAVKAADKNLNLVAFTVSECVLVSRVSGKSLGEVIDMLVEAGVNALPGGGAEIFDESVRKKISPNKLTASEWLGAMQIAHEHSLRTNATMLYGHIETPESVIDHLFKLRDQQDKSGGFKAFVPLPFRKGASDIESKGSGVYDLKICAIARLVLDNFAHIRVPIPHFGDRMAQILLNFGADDIGGTHWHEEVAAAAGAARSNRTEDFMRKTIIAAGFNPVKGTSNYGV